MGLDPGIDHLLAMKMIDRAKTKGYRIKSLLSWCGGLPAPEASQNPFGYKFSWNPLGVLTAGMNAARYKQNGYEVYVPGDQLYSSARDVSLYPGFHLEGLPNRNALDYARHYGILQEADTVFRGTLRYKGYSQLMNGLLKLGMFDTKEENYSNPFAKWSDFLAEKLGTRIENSQDVLQNHVDTVADKIGVRKENAKSLILALRWLGLFDKNNAIEEAGTSLLEKTCSLLEKKLRFKKGERDLVLLSHQIELEDVHGNSHQEICDMILYGESNGHTAMAKAVGIPLAIATKLILKEKITRRGVVIPVHKDIYEPILKELEIQEFQFNEKKYIPF